MIDDLEGRLTLGNAVEVFNRCVRAAHQLLVEIRDNPRLHGLADPGGRGAADGSRLLLDRPHPAGGGASPPRR